MNGASPRPDSRCSSRASSSLPVPLSPRISTVADSFATLCTRSTMSRICWLGPMMELALALLGDLRAERDDLTVQILPLARVAHERSQLVVVEVLGDVVIGAVLHRLHGGLDLVDGRDHDALDEAVVLLDDAQHVEAADARQPDVEQDQVDVLLLQQRQRRFAARHRQDAVVALEDRARSCRASPDRRRRSGWSSSAAMGSAAIVARFHALSRLTRFEC